MGTPQTGIVTGRDKLMRRYQELGKPFDLSTRTYYSTLTFGLDVVNPANGAAFAVLRANQQASCFDYAVKGARPDGFGGTQGIPATQTDTNLTKARQTNGSEEVVIEGLRVSVRDVRTQFAAADIPAGLDPDVLKAFQGLVPWIDIGAIFRPPQIDSPFRLEDALGRLIRPRLSLAFEWDGENKERIGLASHCPDLSSSSLLTSAGIPTADNYYALPEGWVWQVPQSNAVDTELVLSSRVEQTAVFSFNGVTFPGGAPGTFIFPQKLAVDLHVELIGFTLSLQSQN